MRTSSLVKTTKLCLHAVLSLACLAGPAIAEAVSPPPDGGYAGGNTAEGQNALFRLTSGGYNTAVGFFSLRSNTTNSFNTAIGAGALFANSADQNTATGAGALLSNAAGTGNTATGAFALFSNTSGSDNTAVGSNAGAGIMTGSGNICIGALVSGADENNTIRIGNNLPTSPGQSACYIGGIFGQSVDPGSSMTVYADSGGKLGIFLSSQRFKCDIEPMNRASEAVLALKPVTFHYKNDTKNTPCFGLIAEEVAKVDPALVVRDKEGKPYTVRYDAVNAMLLNEFLKEHKKVEQQQRRIAEQEATINKQRKEFKAAITELNKQLETVVARLKEHDSKIQNVSDELELRRASLRTVANDQ